TRGGQARDRARGPHQAARALRRGDPGRRGRHRHGEGLGGTGVSPRRSRHVLSVAAIALGVALAWSSAGSAPKRAAKPAAAAKDTVLARVGTVTITRREVEQRLQDLPEPYRTNFSTPDGRQQFLDRMVEERVWLLGARKHGVDKRPELRRQLEQT